MRLSISCNHSLTHSLTYSQHDDNSKEYFWNITIISNYIAGVFWCPLQHCISLRVAISWSFSTPGICPELTSSSRCLIPIDQMETAHSIWEIQLFPNKWLSIIWKHISSCQNDFCYQIITPGRGKEPRTGILGAMFLILKSQEHYTCFPTFHL